MREIRTSGLMSGGLETRSREPNCRHGAKATERPPDPKAGAPAPDSTIAPRLAFEPARTAHPVLSAVQIQLQQQRRIERWLTGATVRLGMLESELLQVQRVDERIN